MIMESEKLETAQRLSLQLAKNDLRSLALTLAEKHYPDVKFDPLDDIGGLIAQIDNMTSNMHRSWHPIETVPKDGIYVDVFDDEGNRWTDVRFYNGRFEDNGGNWIAVFRLRYWMPIIRPKEVMLCN